MEGHKHLCWHCGSTVTCPSDCDEDPFEETLCRRCYEDEVGFVGPQG